MWAAASPWSSTARSTAPTASPPNSETPNHPQSVTDAGFKALAHLNLTELRLSDCPRLTDAGASALLAAAPRLKRLVLSGCGGTTAQAVEAAAHEASKARGRRIRTDWSR